jgi:formylglycine-generating enzyme
MGRLREVCQHSLDARVFWGEKFRMRTFNGVRFRAWFLSFLVCGFWQSYATAGLITFGSGGNQFTMNFVDIGNAGNADDTTGTPNPAGAVAYAYGLGKYEVSEDMITKFNASQALQITKNTRGVDKPATSVSWNEAARFTNWLNTSTGGSAAYKFTTNGVNDNIALWVSGDAGYDALNPYRNSLATYVLPSMDEWYKAAYYNPNTSSYFDYANGSNSAPTAVASGTADGTAVYDGQLGPADVTSAGGLSPYGIMGLGGNVFEWEETSFLLNNSSGSSVRGPWRQLGQRLPHLVVVVPGQPQPRERGRQRWFPCRKSFVFRSSGARTGVVCSVDTAGDHGCGLSKAEEEITLSTFVLLPFVFRSVAGGGARI